MLDRMPQILRGALAKRAPGICLNIMRLFAFLGREMPADVLDQDDDHKGNAEVADKGINYVHQRGERELAADQHDQGQGHDDALVFDGVFLFGGELIGHGDDHGNDGVVNHDQQYDGEYDAHDGRNHGG